MLPDFIRKKNNRPNKILAQHNKTQNKSYSAWQDELQAHFPDITIDLIASQRAKRVSLRLDAPSRKFKLIKPKTLSFQRALLFAKKHEDWMKSKLSTIPSPINFDHNTIIPLMGYPTKINIIYNDAEKRTRIFWEHHNDASPLSLTPDHNFDDITRAAPKHVNILHIHTNKTDPSARITRFLKSEIKELLRRISTEKAALTGKKIGQVTIRDTKTRWGSCSPEGNLSYSWRIIFAPIATIDYITAHEVAHLTHMDHSPAFWQLCRDLSADFTAGKSFLDHNGPELMRYGA